jgi:hypothetical protein
LREFAAATGSPLGSSKQLFRAPFADRGIDLARVSNLRGSGAVLNTRDRSEQPGASSLPQVELVDLA